MRRLFLATSLMVLLTAPTWGKPPPGADPNSDLSQWYESLRQPGTQNLCCSLSDCRPTQLRPSPINADHWQAFISKKLFGPTAPDDWIDIPEDKILMGKTNPTAQVVICWYAHEVYCAVLPSMT